MRRAAIVLLVTAVSSTVPAAAAAQQAPRDNRSWRTPHVALASAFAVALSIDAAQTREAMRRGYRETNPILGPHPSAGRVNTYSFFAGLTVVGAAAAVPARARPWILGVALAVETFAIAGTVRQGITIKFP
jgi:hypothetical protein